MGGWTRGGPRGYNWESHGGTKMRYSKVEADPEVLALARSTAPAWVDQADGDGLTPAMRAIAAGDAEALCAAINRGCDVEALDRYGESLLAKASKLGQLPCVVALLEAGAKADATSKFYKDTPLAVAGGRWADEIAEVLVEYGADVNAKNGSGATPLSGAVASRNYALVRWLAKAGARVDECEHGGFTALMHAALRGWQEGVRFLLQKGADPTKWARGHACAALKFAVEKGAADCVELLVKPCLENKALAPGDLDLLALSAAGRADAEVLNILLESGARIDAADSAGNTLALSAVCNAENAAALEDCLILLRERGANMGLVNHRGLDALGAARIKRVARVEAMLLAWSEADQIQAVAACKGRSPSRRI